MNKVKVLVTHHLATKRDLDAIAAVDPRVEVMYGLYKDAFARQFLESFKARGASDMKFLDPGTFERDVATAEVIYSLGLPKDIVKIAPRLKWVQIVGAGMDFLQGRGLLEHGVTITTNVGVNAPAIAEFVMLLLLSRIKQFPRRLECQKEHRWQRLTNDELRGRTLGIVGLGHIGQEVAKRAKAFDMTVIGTRRSYKAGQREPNVDEMFPRERLRELLGRSDYVVVAVGLTPETRGMIGETEFKAMKPGSYFINVARGPVVEEPALLRALKEGPMAGAALDVFVQEPLPSESPFWDLPNVLVTPHNTGGMRDLGKRSAEMFCENLRRYVNGQPLNNVVDPDRGY